MPVAPRAASASLSKPEGSGRHGWAKRQRLLRAPEFAAPAGSQGSWRAARRWLALSAVIHIQQPGGSGTPMPLPGVRFGLIVPRRQASRAVARNMVKRILREAARRAAHKLEDSAGARRVDVILRLKAALPDARQSGWRDVKAALRDEADALLGQLADQIVRARPAAGH